MRAVIQRVANASVAVHEEGYESSIGKGLLVLAAFIDEDTDEDVTWTARKIAAMRIFDDDGGVMNLSVKDVDGEILAISQFTLYASTVKGNRPSYIKAAKPDVAVPLYEKFLAALEANRQKAEKLGARIRPITDIKQVHRLLSGSRTSDGFAQLAQWGRLDLSLEALAVDKRFTALFDDEQANTALIRLLDAGHRF